MLSVLSVAVLTATGVAQARAAAPRVTVTAALTGAKLRNTTSATFKITRSPSTAKLTCRFDSGQWAACGATKSVSHLQNGTHTLFIRAAVGSAVSSASAQVRVDTLAPHRPAIANQSGGPTNAPSVAVSSTSVTDVGIAGGVTYQYHTAPWGGRPAHCGTFGSPVAMTGRVVHIDHTGATCVEFRARDAAGNLSGWSGYYVVVIDHTAPTQAVITGADSEWHKSVTLSASASDALSGIGTYEWSVSTDGGETWQAKSSAMTAKFMVTGIYQVRAVAVDGAGNAGPVSNVVTIRVDAAAPTAPTISSAVQGEWTNDPAVTFAGSTDQGSGVIHYTCYKGTALLGTTLDASTPFVAPDGNYSVTCRAVDAAGNVSGPSNAIHLMIDTVPPQLSVAQTSVGTDGNVTVFVPDASDATSGVTAAVQFRYSDDGGASWQDWSDAFGGLTFTDDGSYMVEFQAFDDAGNVTVSDPISFIISH